MINIDALLHNVGVNLRSVRCFHEMSLAKLGEKMGYSHPTLSKIENGKHKTVSIAMLVEFCNVFGVSLSDVLGLNSPRIIQFAHNTTEPGGMEVAGKAGAFCADGYLKALEIAFDEIILLKEILASGGLIQKEATQ